MDSYFRRFFSIVLVVMVVGLLYWGWQYLRHPTTLPFHHVRLVYPTEHIDKQQIKQLVWNHIDGGFFSVNMSQLKKALMHQPWINSVSVRREWPDTMVLSIDEKRPEARWGANGVISAKAEVFYPPPNSIPASLPMIMAPDGKNREIFINFQEISDDVQQLGLRISTLIVNDRDVYQVTLSNGISVMIGRGAVEERFHRFVNLYPKVIGCRGNEVVSIDLRYSNGFAVKWKTKSL